MNEQVDYLKRPGAPISEDDAPVVGRELSQLMRTKGGSIKPDDVVAVARDERHPLHRFFDWDDTTAAAKYRLEQARTLIRSVVVRVVGQTSSEPIRAIVSVGATNNDRRYVAIQDAMSDPTMRAQLLERARREFDSWRTRYSDLNELAAVFEVGERVFATSERVGPKRADQNVAASSAKVAVQ